jgi:SPOR domain
VTFRKEDGSLFVCTYEATSRDKAEEVKYQLNISYFLWDCAAFGAMLAAVVYVVSFVYQRNWLIALHGAGNIGLLIGVGMMGFFGWHFTMQKWRKYRYIFAIQQFKQYHADEQWIAIAEDVFPGPSDPYMIELRNQCVYNGIGLAVIPMEGNVRKLNDPSRLGMYGQDRKIADWVTRSQWYQTVANTTAPLKQFRQKTPDFLSVWFNKITRPLHYLIFDPLKKYVGGAFRQPFNQTATAYTRFMNAQSMQKLIVMLALLIVAPLFWRVISYSEVNAADLDELKEWKAGKNPEDQYGYVIDGEAVPYNSGIPKQYPISTKPKYVPEDEEVQTINLSGSDEEEEEPATRQPPPKVAPQKKATAPPPKAAAADPCSLVKGKSGWIIQDNAFSSKDLANARVAALIKKGIAAQALPQSCLSKGKSGWIVWLGSIQSSEATARTTAANLQKALKRAGFSNPKLMIKSLK